MPCCDPKPVPVMVTFVPGAPLADETLVSTGGLVTVNGAPELETPLTVTTTLPVKAPVGTRTVRPTRARTQRRGPLSLLML